MIRDAFLSSSGPEPRVLGSEELGGVHRHTVLGFLPRVNLETGREAGALDLYVKALMLRDGRTLLRGIFFFEHALWTDSLVAKLGRTALNPVSAAALGLELRVWDVATVAMHRGNDRRVPYDLFKLVPGRKLETYTFPCPFGVRKQFDRTSECRGLKDAKQPFAQGIQMIEFRADLGRLGQELTAPPEVGVWLSFGDWRRGVDLSELVADPEVADLGAVEDDEGRPGEFDPFWHEYRNINVTGPKPREFDQRTDPSLALLDVNDARYVPPRISPEVAPVKRVVQAWRALVTHDDLSAELTARMAQHSLLSGVAGIVAYVHPSYDKRFIDNPTIRRLVSSGQLVPVRWQPYPHPPGYGTYEQMIFNAHVILSHWGRNCMVLLSDVDELIDLPSRPTLALPNKDAEASREGRVLTAASRDGDATGEDARVDAAKEELERGMRDILGAAVVATTGRNASSGLFEDDVEAPADRAAGATARRRVSAATAGEISGAQEYLAAASNVNAGPADQRGAAMPSRERPTSLLGSLLKSNAHSILSDVTSRQGFYVNAGSTSLLKVKTVSGAVLSPGDFLPPATPRQARLAGIFSHGGCLHRDLQAEHSKTYGEAFVRSLRVAGCASVDGLHSLHHGLLLSPDGSTEAEAIVAAKDLSKVMAQYTTYLPGSTWQKPVVDPDSVSGSSVHRGGECLGHRTEPWGRPPPGGIGAPLPIQRRQDGYWNLDEIGIPNKLSNNAAEPPAVRSTCKFIRGCPTVPRQCLRIRHLINLYSPRYQPVSKEMASNADWLWIYREKDWTRPFPK